MSIQTEGQITAISADRAAWTLPEVAGRRISASLSKIFVRDADGRAETYQTFWQHSQRLASRLLDLGVCPGDRILILAPSGLPALHGWMAAGLVGAIDVSVNTAYRGEPLLHVLSASDPSVLVVDTSLLGALAELSPALPSLQHLILIGSAGRLGARWLDSLEWHVYQDCIAAGVDTAKLVSRLPTVQPSDIASVIFTSGTTGPSKGVMMPHAQVCLLALQTIQATGMQETDVYYSAHPLFHIAGKFMGVFATFAAGGTLVLDRKFAADTWLDRIRNCDATLSILHGPMIEMIHSQLPHPDDRDNSLTRLLCCPLPKGIGADFQQRYGVDTIEMWGMSEVGCPCWTTLQPDYVPGSCGRVLEEWYDFAIVDPDTDEPKPAGEVGEIVVRPRHPWTIMQGYLGMPEATARAWRNLWFHSGDAAYQDADGNVFFVDRMGDRIRRRAENISSYDIEATAARNPDVRECAAVGVPSSYQNDDDILLVVVANQPGEIDPLELLVYLAQHLPYFMVPRYIEVIDKLPRTPTNKVRKKELSARGVTSQAWDRQAAGISLRELASRPLR